MRRCAPSGPAPEQSPVKSNPRELWASSTDSLPGAALARSAKASEELAEVTEQQVGGVVRGPVAAAVELAPRDDVGVVALGEPADRSEVEGKASYFDLKKSRRVEG